MGQHFRWTFEKSRISVLRNDVHLSKLSATFQPWCSTERRYVDRRWLLSTRIPAFTRVSWQRQCWQWLGWYHPCQRFSLKLRKKRHSAQL